MGFNKLYEFSETFDQVVNEVIGDLDSDVRAMTNKGTITRPAAQKVIWAYIKKNNLQDQKDKRTILSDKLLKELSGKRSFNMMEISKFLSQHLFEVD